MPFFVAGGGLASALGIIAWKLYHGHAVVVYSFEKRADRTKSILLEQMT